MDEATKRLIPPQLQWILVAFVATGLVYLWATPIFEVSDELWHFGMVEYIRHNRSLPIQGPQHPDTTWRQEGSQPPLYYALAAALTLPFGLSDVEQLRQPNPHAKIGIPGAYDNKNMVLHDELTAPLRGTALAVYVVRLFGILLGIITVTAVYFSARRLGGDGVGLIAAGLTAFNPMFLFVSASVNNDNLVTALNSIVIYLTLRMLRGGFHTRRSLLVAVLLALASLSKLSGLVLLPVVAIAAFWVAYRRRDWRGVAVLAVSVAAFWLILAGWWYARNLILYDELFGTATMVDVAGPRLEPFTLQTLIDEVEGFRIAYWGLFGAVNIMTVPLFYAAMDVITVLAAAGILIFLWRRWHAGIAHLSPLLLLLLVVAVSWASVINWTAQTYASQGRLLFPFVAANSTLLALGLTTILRLVFRTRSVVPLRYGVALLGLFALYVPIASVVPQYAAPKPIDTLPDGSVRVFARYGDVTLVGYETPDRRYQPGAEVPITLFWQPIAQSEQDYSLYLHLLDGQGQEIGKVDTFPGGGRLRTSTWRPGAIYADRYRVQIKDGVSGSFALRMLVGWWHYPTQVTLLPTAESGLDIGSVVLDVGGFASTNTPDTSQYVDIEPVAFDDVIVLEAYQFDQNLLSLLWRANGTPREKYTVFAQVVDEQQHIVGQGDAPPALPTDYWRKNEHYLTVHSLNYVNPLTAGQYYVIVGWYNPVDFARLQTDHAGDAYELTQIVIDAP